VDSGRGKQQIGSATRRETLPRTFAPSPTLPSSFRSGLRCCCHEGIFPSRLNRWPRQPAGEDTSAVGSSSNDLPAVDRDSVNHDDELISKVHRSTAVVGH